MRRSRSAIAPFRKWNGGSSRKGCTRSREGRPVRNAVAQSLPLVVVDEVVAEVMAPTGGQEYRCQAPAGKLVSVDLQAVVLGDHPAGGGELVIVFVFGKPLPVSLGAPKRPPPMRQIALEVRSLDAEAGDPCTGPFDADQRRSRVGVSFQAGLRPSRGFPSSQPGSPRRGAAGRSPRRAPAM